MFLKEVRTYCQDKEYEFVWFCKDIEDVYLGHRIDANQKQAEAAAFKRKKSIETIVPQKLSARVFHKHESNILTVLDSYKGLKKK